MALKISLYPSMAVRWAESMLHIPAGRAISRPATEEPIGRPNFAQSATFNRVARRILNPLYAQLYSHAYALALYPVVRRALFGWYAILISPSPRCLGSSDVSGFYTVY